MHLSVRSKKLTFFNDIATFINDVCTVILIDDLKTFFLQ